MNLETVDERFLAPETKIELLKCYEFVYLSGGLVLMGTKQPLSCKVEGYRHSETPQRVTEIAPFWICRFKVTNSAFEKVFPKHRRPEQSSSDNHPVVDVTYGEALTFCERVNAITGMDFRLPTEIEWVFAAAPYGQFYAYGQERTLQGAHVFGDGQEFGTVPVGDSRWSLNWCGLDQMGSNVREMTAGYFTAPGHYGAESDGCYCITKGGDYGHCINTPRVVRRSLFDIADRSTRVGFRLAHSKV